MPPEADALALLEDLFVNGDNPEAAQVRLALNDGYRRLLSRAMETELRLVTKQRADEQAIRIFASNLRQLLLSPPLSASRVMGIDPGYRTGCKVVCLDRQGKLLHNGTVAMTGGQPVDGPITVPAIAHSVRAEGVDRIALLSDEPDQFDAADFPAGTTIHDRRELDAVQRELREIPGVTVLIYAQTCATEKRRRRKRGKLEDPKKFVVINDLVCEGCGDCSLESNCLSVIPKETPFGRKRQIDQNNCNKDFSCVNGFCPSFVTVEGGAQRIEVRPLPPAPARPPFLGAIGRFTLEAEVDRERVGGEVTEYTKMMAESREQAIDRMLEEAHTLGANAVVSVRFMTSMVMSGAAEILAFGTAVVVEEER